MHPTIYLDLIKRAVAAGDDKTLEGLTRQLADSEDAKAILRAKGFGCTGMDLLSTAKLVPRVIPK